MADAQAGLGIGHGIGQVALRRGEELRRLGRPARLHEQVDGLHDGLAALGPAARREVEGAAGQRDRHRRGHPPDLRRCPPQQAGRGDVAGLGDIHDQVGDVGGGGPVLKHHLDRGAPHAPPHRFGQAGIDGLADEVMPESQTVAVLGQQPGGDRLPDLAPQVQRRPAEQPGQLIEGEAAAEDRSHLHGVPAPAGQPRELAHHRVDQPDGAGARPHPAWPCRRRRSPGARCGARAAARSAGTAGRRPG